MEEKVLKIKTVHQCNCCMKTQTLHPLVSVIDLSEADLSQYTYIRFGFYTVFLQEHSCADFVCGRQTYDYSDGTLIFLSPGEYFNLEKEKAYTSRGLILAFHPDLICGTSLGENIGVYTFFNYHICESLHLSLREKQVITECMQNIRREVQHCIDKYSKILISGNIELMLDYCRRFYERQFITRNHVNKAMIEKVDLMIDGLISDRKIKDKNYTCTACFARRLHLSTAYFNDMLKHESGKELSAYILSKCFEAAQTLLRTTDKPISQIAFELGFPSTQYFSRLFKRITGNSPHKYKSEN